MSEKTILKLHANGNLEMIGTGLTLVAPTNNLFILANMSHGYVHRDTGIVNIDTSPNNLQEGASEFIPVNEGEFYTIQATWDVATLRNVTGSWSFWSLSIYDKDKKFISRRHEHNSNITASNSYTFVMPVGVAFVRITVSHLDHIINNKRCATISFVKGFRKPYNESVYDQYQQGKVVYSFSTNSVTLPNIIEYPPEDYRNYFIEDTSVLGNLNAQGQLTTTDNFGLTTDFIPVSEGEQVTVKVTYSSIGTNTPWVACSYYNVERQFMSRAYGINNNASTLQRTITVPSDVAYLRYSFNEFGNSVGDVKRSIEKKATATVKHYLAHEDLPNWVRDTGNPISIFPQGIVIKGDLIHTEQEQEQEPPESDVLFMDDFNRPDANTLGDNWTLGRGSFAIENNMARATGGANVSSTAFCTLRHGDNISLTADIRRNSSESLIFRASDAFNTVFAHLEGADLKLKQTINSVTTTLRTVYINTNTTAFYRVRVELRGAEIKVYVDDTLHITHTLNANLNNTLCGFHSWSGGTTNGRFDNFIVKKLPINE